MLSISLIQKNYTKDKEIVSDLDYDGIEFPVQEKDFSKIETKNNMFINVFGYKKGLIFPIYVSDQKFENSMDLLLSIDYDKSYYVYIKDFNSFMFHKTKNKNKKYFCKSCLQCFRNKNVLPKQKEDCLRIHDIQSVNVEKGAIEFKKYFKQISVTIKIYAHFECNHIPCSFAYKVVYIDDKFSKPIVVFKVKMLLMNLLKQFLRNTNTVKNNEKTL